MRFLFLLAAIALLVAAGRLRRSVGQRPLPEQAGDQPDVWDPWAILGVARGASRDDIRRGYRAQMKRYHPDRVDDLGDDLRAAAHAKVLDIQRAYHELGGD